MTKLDSADFTRKASLLCHARVQVTVCESHMRLGKQKKDRTSINKIPTTTKYDRPSDLYLIGLVIENKLLFSNVYPNSGARCNR